MSNAGGEPPTYPVVVTREGGQWLADVPTLGGAHTYARSLARLDRSVREVIAMAADLPYNAMPNLPLHYSFSTGDPAIDEAGTIRDLRVQAKRLTEEASARTDEAARRLTSRGVSVRDAAELLGISPQRVAQLSPQHVSPDPTEVGRDPATDVSDNQGVKTR